ncbi:MAG: hypothetical protein ACYTGB_07800, partial [Planctomycetota bacterium]
GGHGWLFVRHRGVLGLRAGNIWLYDTAADRWTPMCPASGPRARAYRALAWSPDHFVSLMFSGEIRKNDTWAYDSYANTWFEIDPEVRPPRFTAGGMCYDRRRRLFVMLAGVTPPAEGVRPEPRGLWTFDPATCTWKELRPKHSPPAGRESLVAYDEVAGQAVCFAAVRAGAKDRWKMQVWALDLDAPDWTEVTPPGEGPAYFNQCAAYVPDLNIHVIGPGHTNWRTGDPCTREVWTYRHRSGRAPPGFARADWSLRTEDRAVIVTGPPRRNAACALLRAEGDRPWSLSWKEISADVGGGEFRDEKVERGKVYWYRLRVPDGLTAPRRAQPAVPTCPVVSPVDRKKVEVTWAASPEPDVVGYNIYRARVRIRTAHAGEITRLRGPEAFKKLNGALVAGTGFTDRTVDLGAAEPSGYRYALYAYNVRAVNRLGAESGPSPFALTLPEQVERPVIEKAAPGRVALRWPRLPSAAIVGYNLYRMASTYGKPEKLNPEPLAEPAFTDESMPGDGTRRYTVLAVDRLGQEGISSPEVWAFRRHTAAEQQR